jgi:hypothetical protein
MCSLLLSCGNDADPRNTVPEVTVPEEQKKPDDPEKPCGCECVDQTIDGHIGYKELLVWNYPVKPGMPEWAQLGSTEEMYDTCMIPEDILPSLSTEDLTKICLQHPLLSIFSAQTNWMYGIELQFENFNGLRELFQREGVANELLKWYNKMLQKVESMCTNNNDFDMLDVSNIEALFCKYQKHENDADYIYVEVLKHLVSWYETKLMYKEVFGSYSFRSNYLSRAIIIEKISPGILIERIPQGEKNPVFLNGDSYYAGTYEIINELSYKLIQ